MKNLQLTPIQVMTLRYVMRCVEIAFDTKADEESGLFYSNNDFLCTLDLEEMNAIKSLIKKLKNFDI